MEDKIKLLMFLVDEYHMSYAKQTFEGRPFGNYNTTTYSFYNETGCFTIRYMFPRVEWDCYRSLRFDNDCDVLFEQLVPIDSIEPEIWKKHMKVGIFKRPFFWWSTARVFAAFAEALKVHLEKGNDFFGIY